MPFKGEIFLACRYLRPQKSLITLLTYISLLGPMLGVAVLIVVTSIMNGMPQKLVESIIEYNPHITIESKTPFTDTDSLIEDLEQKYNFNASPVTPLKVFLEKDKSIQPFLAKGIYPFKYNSFKNIENIVGQTVKGIDKLQPNEIILSNSAAMNFRIGDEIILHSPAKYKAMLRSQKDGKMTRFNINSSKAFKVAGYYKVPHRRVDQRYIIMHQDTANELLSLDWGESLNIEIKLKEPDSSTNIIEQLKQQSELKDYTFTPWQNMNDGIYNRIKQEKLQITFVLFLIMAATGVGIGACIFSLVIQKTKDIGVLKATGVTPGSIVLIFLGQGAFIGILGSTIGYFIGITALEYRSTIAVFLGKFYSGMSHLERVPMFLDPTDIKIILWGAVAICLVAALIPAIIAASINPVKALQSGN